MIFVHWQLGSGHHFMYPRDLTVFRPDLFVYYYNGHQMSESVYKRANNEAAFPF